MTKMATMLTYEKKKKNTQEVSSKKIVVEANRALLSLTRASAYRGTDTPGRRYHLMRQTYILLTLTFKI